MASPKNSPKINAEVVIVRLSDVRVERFRPLDEKHLATIVASMRARGFSKEHPIPCFQTPKGDLIAFGGAHRHAAAGIVKIDDGPVILRPIDHEPTRSELLAAAISDNDHLPNGENTGRMGLRYLQALKNENPGTKLPKAEDIAGTLSCSESMANKLIAASKRASESLTTHYLNTPSMTWRLFEEFYTRFDKHVQNDRVSKGELSLPKPYAPLVRAAKGIEFLRYIAPYLGLDGELLVVALCDEDEQRASVASAQIKEYAKAYYENADKEAATIDGETTALSEEKGK